MNNFALLSQKIMNVNNVNLISLCNLLMRNGGSTRNSLAVATQLDIFPRFKICNSCGSQATLQSKGIRNGKEQLIFQCSRRGCREKQSLYGGTIFEMSHLDPKNVIFFIYYWSYNMHSFEVCNRELGMAEHTFVNWCHFMRDICVEYFIKNPVRIGGIGHIVEIDESVFAKRKYHVGRLIPQRWVFGGIDRETKSCFLQEVPDRKAETLMAIIREKIIPGSTIFSDEWRSYSRLDNEYLHGTVNHTYNFVDPESEVHTQTVENNWMLAKTQFRKRFGTVDKFRQEYLVEFMWRRKFKDNPFQTILAQIQLYRNGVLPPEN